MTDHISAPLPHAVDVLVVGAGPAGLAAAAAAASGGAKVAVLDDNAAPGGQIWRTGTGTRNDSLRDNTLRNLRQSGAQLLSGQTVVDAPHPNTLQTFCEVTGEMHTFRWNKLILATGARERFLPFPGWTLPGVFGAGGLQALVRGGFAVAGRRIVVAGTGPLLLAIAAHLREAGAQIVAIAEQASLRSLISFGTALLAYPGKLLQGAGYRARLGSTPYRTGCWPVAAEGTGRLTAVRLTNGSKTWTEPCDLLACGFNLVPNTELPTLLECGIDEGFVSVDANQTTSKPGIYCVGEPTGIAGLEAALVQGRIAGLAATDRLPEAAALHPRRNRERAFGRRLERAFALRPELRTLAQPETIVCRCEDVSFAQLQPYIQWTEAKLQTRCGMGPCQGRICGPALETLFGWRNTSVRPPLFPVPVSALLTAAMANDTTTQQLQETP